VDVLFPASEAFSAAVAAGAALPEAFRALRTAAGEGRARARDMIAQHGRLAYYQEQSKGRDDPGAVACTYMLQCFSDHVSGPA
jgi:dihydroxyacetone kinase